jgi:hypothetical protein
LETERTSGPLVPTSADEDDNLLGLGIRPR